ncbi:hypothetical protein [Crossiella sp. CA198]|uniref:hypothetical protein n=1 Tax=Crossiella sp. CA198 TaxID=3455607 RepID=UPI003F8D6AB3
MSLPPPSTVDTTPFPFAAEDPDRLGMVSVDVDVTVGVHREWREVAHHRFVLAKADGVGSYVTGHRGPAGERHQPEFEALLGGELGRQHRDHRATYAELVLDQPLRRGEAQVLEWRWLFADCTRTAHRYRGHLRHGVDSLGARLTFHPDALPVRVVHSWQPDSVTEPVPVHTVEVDRTGLVELLIPEPRPGWHSFQWDWE